MHPEIEPLSFFIGLASGIILSFLWSRMLPAFKEIRAGWKSNRAEVEERRSTGVEDNLRRVTLRRAQGMHLAAPLFALDEILIPPMLIAPPPRVEPGGPLLTEDTVNQTLPYLPAWPEMASIYRAPTLTIQKALSGGAHLVITGPDGIGKTVALAHLATLAAHKDSSLGELGEAVPFLIHAADLNLPVNDVKNVLNPIINVISEHAAVLDLPRLPGFTQFIFKNGHALLLLDGYDELAPEAQQLITDYLKLLLGAYPQNRVVVTTLPEQVGGLPVLGFAPLALIGWGPHQHGQFIRKWGEQWTRFVNTEAWAQTGLEAIDSVLLETWLALDNQTLTPLELTLKVWAGYAGDSLGPRVLDAIASHIRRVAPVGTPTAALETLAMQSILSSQPVFDTRKAREWVKSFEVAEEKPAEGQEEAAGENVDKPKTGPLGQKPKTVSVQTPSLGLLGKMSASGLLVAHSNGRMRFLHPVLAGFLAGRALAAVNAEETLLRQPNWGGKMLALRYYAAHGNAAHVVDIMLGINDPLLFRPLLTTSRWLRDAPREAAWRGKLMAGLAKLLQSEGHPRGLRAQAVSALALSGDAGAASFFRQAMQSNSFELISLAALGCGAVQDSKAVELLSSTLTAPSLSARRAACLALVAIGTPNALEEVARALLQGDDELRRAAAEALANDPREGHEMLRDGATMPDILVRRAVVYGLARVSAPWAMEIVQKIQLEDDQWIVRNAATEVIDSKAIPADPRVPRPLTPPSQTPWLIEFAGKQGVGISPGAPATDILLTAIKHGTEDERKAALPYLRRAANEGIVKEFYHIIRDKDPEMSEAAYQAIWDLASSGMNIPDPTQFGLS
jgi:hypothetical protein